MLSAEQQAEAQKRLKVMAEQQEAQKAIKSKIKNVSKSLNDKLKQLSQGDSKKACEVLGKLNEQYLTKFLLELESKNYYLVNSFEDLKNEKQQLNRERINAIDDKQRYSRSIVEIKETISKIQKAIEESIKEEEDKRKKIQEDVDKSIAEIKEKVATFEKQSLELEEQNKTLQQKKEGIIAKMTGLESQFKSKAEQKDEAVKKQRQELMQKLKQVQAHVNEATQMNKQFTTLQKKNFDSKLSIYLRTKKFPQICNSMQNSATTIQKCKNELSKGVQRLLKAMQITKKCEAESKQINEKCLQKLKLKSEKEQKLKVIKGEKQTIKQRILQLQNQKKQRQQASNTQ